MIFKLYDCDFGMKIAGVDYAFTHVDSVTIEDPEFNRLTRGANAQDLVGLPYKEGLKEPKTITIPILNMSAALKEVLDGCYSNQTRIESVYAISRKDGSNKMAKQAILCQRPMQKTLDESPESMNVELMFQSFDLTEVHKS